MTPSSRARRGAPRGELNRRLAEETGFAGDLLGEVLQVLIADAFDKMTERQGLTRAELAERVGCDPGFVSGVLNGSRNITLKTIGRFAVALGSVPSLAPNGRNIPLERFSMPSIR